MAIPDQGQPVSPTAFTPRAAGQQSRRWRVRPLSIALAAVLLLFAAVLWFLFNAHSVLFIVEPPAAEIDADIDIDGGLHLPLGRRQLLLAGTYRVQLRAQGYRPLERVITVTGEDGQQERLQLQMLPGLLGFDSTPPGAQIIIDEQLLGTTPLAEVEVVAGQRQLRVLAERYLPLQQPIAVTGLARRQMFAFRLIPAWAEVSVSSVPAAATVYVDGEAVATTPALLEILQGEHQLELALAHYRNWQQTLSVRAGVAQLLEPIVLQAAAGLLKLRSSPSTANVTVDGEYRGQTPLDIDLDPDGSHRLAVFRPGYVRAARDISLQPGEEQTLHLRLVPQLGAVRVEVEPVAAVLWIGGRARGRGSQTLSLPAHEHILEVRLDGYQSQSQRFTPRPGLKQVITVQLLTESEVKRQSIKPRIVSATGMALRLFSPAAFTMGASRREPGRRANEVLHPVSLKRQFYLAEKEVSNLEFRKFRQSHSSGSIESHSLDGDDQPVVKVSWNEAALYCNWLSAGEQLPLFYRIKNGRVSGFNARATGYRLPSEAEWARAARVKPSGLLKYPWGTAYPPPQVFENYADASSAFITGRRVSAYNDGYVVTAPVGSFPANHRGLYDMGGNVAEWVHDVYALPGSSGVAEVNLLGAQQGDRHVIRGAGWAHGTVTELRLSFRDYGQDGRDDVGFRLARFAEETR